MVAALDPADRGPRMEDNPAAQLFPRQADSSAIDSFRRLLENESDLASAMEKQRYGAIRKPVTSAPRTRDHSPRPRGFGQDMLLATKADVTDQRPTLHKHQIHKSDGSIAVPDRQSSRGLERVEKQLSAAAADDDDDKAAPNQRPRPRDDAHTIDWESGPSQEEVQAAKQILERFIMVGSHPPEAKRPVSRKESIPPKAAEPDLSNLVSLTSATPPPITKPRRIILDESSDEVLDDSSDDGEDGDADPPRQPLSEEHDRLGGLTAPGTGTRGHRSLSSAAQKRAGGPPTSLQPLPGQSLSIQEEEDRLTQGPRTPVLDHEILYDGVKSASPLTKPAGVSQPSSYRPSSSYDFRSFDSSIDAVNGNGHNRSNTPSNAPPESLGRRASFRGSRDFHTGGNFQNDRPYTDGVRAALNDHRRRYSDDLSSIRHGGSIRSKVSDGRHNNVMSGSPRMPDFFGPTIYQVVLHNPTTAHQLLKFSESRLCGENIEFLQKVDQYHQILNDLVKTTSEIHKNYVSVNSNRQINLQGSIIAQLQADIRGLVSQTLPTMERIFDRAQAGVEDLIYTDVYPAFVRHQLALSASRALARDRSRYQGLGDCFTLTDPRRPDNPIAFASDGFVAVTGYSRTDIIPRNCRFLQGPQTDRQAVARVREAVKDNSEIVELLLNYKKNGEPFWNLLYCAPLFDESGRLAFFIGGQVNCSTTIHSSADVMRVLSMSSNPAEAEEAPSLQSSVAKPVPESQPTTTAPAPQHRKGSARKTFLKVLGVRLHDNAQTSSALAQQQQKQQQLQQQQQQQAMADAGMEQKILDKMEGQDIAAQMREFYTAYSKYIVMDDTFTIRFFSNGITAMLHPANNVGSIAGTDVFAFLRQNAVPALAANGGGGGGGGGYSGQPDYKSRVRAALRAGSPISIEVRLQTRRSAAFRGDEVFAAHWTPLKNERGDMCWIVLTLGAMLGN